MNRRDFQKNESRVRVRRAMRMWIAGAVASLASQATTAAPFPAEIELRDLNPANGGDGSIGVYLEGLTPNDLKGFSIDGTGDIDGDGLDDFVLGAPGNSVCDRCGAYVVFGRTELPPSIDVFTLPLESDGADAFVFKTLDSHDLGGRSVSRIGDLNGDGFEDFAVGAPRADPDGADSAGQAYVVFGRDTGYPPTFDAEDLVAANGGDGSEGFILSGTVTDDESGYALSGGCDVNGDGIDDLVLGSNDYSVVSRVNVVFGRASGFPPEFGLARLLPPNGGDGSEGFAIDAAQYADSPGYSVSCAGDTNGDGIDDLLIGAPNADPSNSLTFRGEAFVVFGRSTAFPPVFSLATLLAPQGGDGSEGFVLIGMNDHDYTGLAVASADVNGDGLADMIVAAPGADPNGERSGRVFVVYGRTAPFPATFGLPRLLPPNGDGTEGFVLNGVPEQDLTGYRVANAGDVNDDDIADFLIAAPYVNRHGTDSGGAYLVFGRNDGFPAVFELSRLLAANGGDGSQGVFLVGAGPGHFTGRGIGSAGDVNGDGADDVLVGAPDIDLGPLHDFGVAYLVYGRPASVDQDGDGVADDEDNCSALANADQRDTDADGFGNVCDADLNNDCTVNFTDLGELKVLFFTSDPDADFNGDGAVNFTDLRIMKAGFFLPPGPSGVPNICEARVSLLADP
jgi:hypothetical protein